VPKQLTDEHKWHMWKHACSFCSDIVKKEKLPCSGIVTGNETWVHHYEPANKCQSMEWKYISLPRTKKFKSVPSVNKVMLILIWDFSGPIMKHC